MAVATGKLTPSAVYQTLYKVKGRNIDNSSFEDDNDIIYAIDSSNKLINVKNNMQSIN
jgi:hypothetical protein